MAYNQTQHNIVKLPAWRRRLLLLLILGGFIGLFVRNVYLQSLHKDFLQQKGDARYSRNMVLQAHRGKISDRNGELLAISSPVESVWASPPDVVISPEKTQKMASLLGMKVRDINNKLVDVERGFVYIKRRISPDLAAQVMSLNIT
jgi:cell division protein FtsI (penicillin-binding protein 3)